MWNEDEKAPTRSTRRDVADCFKQTNFQRLNLRFSRHEDFFKSTRAETALRQLRTFPFAKFAPPPVGNDRAHANGEKQRPQVDCNS